MRRLDRRRSARRLAFERVEPRTMFAATTTNDFGWSDAFAPTAGHMQVDDVEVDAKGNRYLVGTMWGSGNASASIDFDPGQGVALRTSVAGNAGQTAFVVKLDARGGLVWDREFSATNIGYGGLSVAVDSTGNVIIGGGFSGTADFDPSAGSVIRKSSFNPDAIGIPSTTHQDLFLLKLNSSGTYLWDRRIPLAPQAVAAVRCGLGVATNGAVYVAGEFAGTVDFDPGAGTSNLASTVGVTSGGAAYSTTDIYMLKLAPAGTFAWARRVGGTANEEFGDLAVDASNNMLVSGGFEGTVDFNPSPMNLPLASPALNGRSLPGDFALKLAADATFRFAVTSGDVAVDIRGGIDTDAAGNVFLATQRAVDATTFETRLRKLSAIGAMVWDARFSPVPPLGEVSFVISRGLTVDGSGNVFVVDYGNNTLRQITAAGVVSTVAGAVKIIGDTDSVGSAARFFDPTDVVADGSSLYIVDSSNNLIRKAVPASQAALPVISLHPASQEVSEGQAVTLRVTATGATGYRWLRNNAPIEGATASALSISAAQASDVGLY
ncbi:MAG: hypothetical protein EBR23_06630, partial [Planctomycetia bacterium]|nr:hypothetical protein [Planctomycetia bacterium]